jgi:hypothetical protein
MIETIQEHLQAIEHQEQVTIFYACESGSRAWGFPSADSDYDVRFLYVHPTPWYLSIAAKREVIEYPEHTPLDISGWELRKALRLFRKSNPPLFEWLGSPLVYLERGTIAAQLRELAARYYSPKACIYHYLHMAQGNYREYLRGAEVWIKKYFYVLRPLLAIQWIEQGKGVAPTAFGTLLEQLDLPAELRTEVQKLIEAKRGGAELEFGPRIAVISDFIDRELQRLEAGVTAAPVTAPIDELDRLFREALHQLEASAAETAGRVQPALR